VTTALDRWKSARIGGIRWWWLALLPLLAVLGAINVVAVAGLISATLNQTVPNDWYQFHLAAQRIASGLSPYTVEPPWTFRWSPVAAWLLVPLTAVGPIPWMVAQFASLLLLPRRAAVVALLTFPFWADVYEGNILTFTFVLAVLALGGGRGSRFASLAYLGVVMLVPRPLTVPVAIWLLWRRPQLRVPAVTIFAVHAVLVALSGYGTQWLQRLATSGDEIAAHNAGPSALIGAWWVPIGLVLAAYLIWRGRLGLASVAASPYLILYYWLFVLLELVPARRAVQESGGGEGLVAAAVVEHGHYGDQHEGQVRGRDPGRPEKHEDRDREPRPG
jgi:hypothetical protein